MTIWKPLVSVVIPTKNCAPYITEAIESIANQDYDNIEIIIVDDGSTDNTDSIIQPYRNIIIYKKKEAGGIGNARNAGMDLARGNYIAWFDADDLCHPQRILIQAAYLDYNSKVDIVCSGFSAFNEQGVISESYAPVYYSMLKNKKALCKLFTNHDRFKGEKVTWQKAPFDKFYDVYWGNIWERIVWGNIIHPPTVIFRKKVWECGEKLSTSIQSGVEWEYFIRITKKYAVAYIDSSLVYYRRHKDQITSDTAANAKELPLVILDVILTTLKKNPELARKYRSIKNRTLARCYSRIAYAFAEYDRLYAINCFLKSIVLNPLQPRLFNCFARILLPPFIINTIRRLKNVSV
ncbi:MAG: glycosyltransferase family 2 protein [Candidatus Latescibacteria bacterium]|nr:glycosyltransferase family 2 protein [Candidatus Latescibacterota bacterium]